MTATRHKRLAIGLVAVLGIGAAVLAGMTAQETPSVAVAATALGAGGEFHPVTPDRVLDTRTPRLDVAPAGAKPTTTTGSSFNVPLINRGGLPSNPAQVLAVVANVTVAGPSVDGFLRIRPAGAKPTDASLVNFKAGRDVPNMVIVGLGTNGAVTVDLVGATANGHAHVLIDVYGWIATSSYTDTADAGTRLIPISPSRILDTRGNLVPADWPAGAVLQPGSQLRLPVRGAPGVPNQANITGVLVNVTAVNVGGGSTFVSAVPNRIPAGTLPATSVTNLTARQIKANTAIVPIGPDGTIHLFNAASPTHLIVDVLGYFRKGDDAASTTGRIVPLAAPFRAFDTRQPAFGKTPLGFASVEEWSFKAFADSITIPGWSSAPTQSALIGNLTASNLSRLYPSQPVNTYLTAFPGGEDRPNSSIVNLVEGEDVPNTALIKYSRTGNVVQVYNDNGSVHYILDVFAVVLA